MKPYDIFAFGKRNRIEVMDTDSHQNECEEMFRQTEAADSGTFEIAVTVIPKPDHSQEQSDPIISVYWNEHLIGYFPDYWAAEYQQLKRITASGYAPRTNARVTTTKNANSDREFRIILELPEPDLLTPLNNPPEDDFVVLPIGRKLQAVKEKDHIDVLSKILPDSGYGHILLSMHLVSTGPRNNRKVVELRIDGQRVGEMSSVSSEKFEPAVQHFSSLGLECIVHGTINGSSLSSEVEVFAAKSNELEEDILQPDTGKPLPQLVDYQDDPNKYHVDEQDELTPEKDMDFSDVSDSQAGEFEDYELSDEYSEGLSANLYSSDTAADLYEDEDYDAEDEDFTEDEDKDEAEQDDESLKEKEELKKKRQEIYNTFPPASDVITLEEWQYILRPDGTRRAAGYQRKYVRSLISDKSLGASAPRLDYITIGQCEQVLLKLDEDPSELMKNGRQSRFRWWFMRAFLIPFLLLALASAFPRVGGAILWIWIIRQIYLIITHFRLKPPFNRQQSLPIDNVQAPPPVAGPQPQPQPAPIIVDEPSLDISLPDNFEGTHPDPWSVVPQENAQTTADAPARPDCVSAPVKSSDPSDLEWVMPEYQGKYICDWLPVIKQLKREKNFEEALEIAQGCMDAMVEVAKRNPANVMEYYVKELVMLQQKVRDPQTVANTLEGWFSLGLPAPREDYRVDLKKRLVKAKQSLASQNGEDPTLYAKEWLRLRNLEKELKASPNKSAAISTGKSMLTTGTVAPVFAGPSTRIGSPSNYHDWIAPGEIFESKNFVAVDFETANSSKVSACQIALVKVEDGQIVDRFNTLLRPPAKYSNFEFTHIHGITLDMVAQAPQWDDVASYVQHWIGELPVYAHNANFDHEVWCEIDAYFDVETLPEHFYCSYRTARQLIQLPNYKLPTVTEALVPDFQLKHHDAGSDAEACARIILALQKL